MKDDWGNLWMILEIDRPFLLLHFEAQISHNGITEKVEASLQITVKVERTFTQISKIHVEISYSGLDPCCKTWFC